MFRLLAERTQPQLVRPISARLSPQSTAVRSEMLTRLVRLCRHQPPRQRTIRTLLVVQAYLCDPMIILAHPANHARSCANRAATIDPLRHLDVLQWAPTSRSLRNTPPRQQPHAHRCLALIRVATIPLHVRTVDVQPDRSSSTRLMAIRTVEAAKPATALQTSTMLPITAQKMSDGHLAAVRMIVTTLLSLRWAEPRRMFTSVLTSISSIVAKFERPMRATNHSCTSQIISVTCEYNLQHDVSKKTQLPNHTSTQPQQDTQSPDI